MWHFTRAGYRQVSPDSLAVTRLLVCAAASLLGLLACSGADKSMQGAIHLPTESCWVGSLYPINLRGQAL